MRVKVFVRTFELISERRDLEMAVNEIILEDNKPDVRWKLSLCSACRHMPMINLVSYTLIFNIHEADNA